MYSHKLGQRILPIFQMHYAVGKKNLSKLLSYFMRVRRLHKRNLSENKYHRFG